MLPGALVVGERAGAEDGPVEPGLPEHRIRVALGLDVGRPLLVGVVGDGAVDAPRRDLDESADPGDDRGLHRLHRPGVVDRAFALDAGARAGARAEDDDVAAGERDGELLGRRGLDVDERALAAETEDVFAVLVVAHDADEFVAPVVEHAHQLLGDFTVGTDDGNASHGSIFLPHGPLRPRRTSCRADRTALVCVSTDRGSRGRPTSLETLPCCSSSTCSTRLVAAVARGPARRVRAGRRARDRRRRRRDRAGLARCVAASVRYVVALAASLVVSDALAHPIEPADRAELLGQSDPDADGHAAPPSAGICPCRSRSASGAPVRRAARARPRPDGTHPSVRQQGHTLMDFFSFGPIAAILDGAYASSPHSPTAVEPVVGTASGLVAVVILTDARPRTPDPGRALARCAPSSPAGGSPRSSPSCREKHGKDRETLARKTMELYQTEKASPFAGILPLLLQIPVISLVYALFTHAQIAGHANALLAEQRARRAARNQLRRTRRRGRVGLAVDPRLPRACWCSSRP